MAKKIRGANGRSTIIKRPDGRWHGYVSMGMKGNGKRDRRHVSSESRSVVVKKVRALELKRDASINNPDLPTLKVEEWLTYWVENIAPSRIRPRTQQGYASIIRMHIVPRMGQRRLDQVTPEHLEQAYAEMVAGGLSPATVLRIHRMLHRAFKVAMQRQRISRNVVELVEPPKQRRPETPIPLDVDEAKRVLAAASGRRNAARWTVALAMGLRQSEALALQWRDINFEKHTLSVQRGIHRIAGVGLVFDEPKTSRSRRTLALPNPLVDALRVQREEQEVERVRAGSEWNDTWGGLVFAQEDGTPVDKKSDYDYWCALLKETGVRHIRLHDARHTAATLLLSEGIHPRVVMELLGHSQMRTTTDTYSHVMPALAQEAAERMAKALWDPELK